MTTKPYLPEVGDLIDRGRYRIDRQIGEGGMGVVFAATHLQLGKPRAIKWLLPELTHEPEAVQRFLAEALIAAKINHPNVVSPVDVSQDAGTPYIVMELLEGETLEQHIAGRALPLAEAAGILLPVLQGVAAAHDQGVVHRDLKPGNVFLVRSNAGALTPKVLDFGIAKVLDGSRTFAALTMQGAVLGTIQYMAPEQLEDPSRVRPAADVYALGVMLYRMLSGRQPYTGNLLDIALRIREGNATPLRTLVPDLPESVDAIVQRALAPSLAQRYTDARSFAAALAAVPECAAPPRSASARPRVRWNVRRSFPRVQDLPELAGLGTDADEEPSTLRPVTTEATAPAARTMKRAAFAAAALMAGAGAAIAAWPVAKDVEGAEGAALAPAGVPIAAADAGTPDASAPGWEDLGTEGR